MNELTTVFAQYLGPIMLVIGVSLIANKKFFVAMFKEMEKCKMLMLLSGILAMVAGFAIVLNHCLFTSFTVGLITVIGMASLLKGLLLILLPNTMLAIVKFYLKRIDKFLIWDALGAIVLGGYLIYVGYLI